MNVKQAYGKIDNLEKKLLEDLKEKEKSLTENFQAYADYAIGFLEATGKEINYALIEKAIRKSKTMKKIWLQLDKVKYSYNELVREITIARKNSIAKEYVTIQGADESSTIDEILKKYEIKIEEGMFTKSTYIIAETRKSDIEKKYSEKLLQRKEIILPNNMHLEEFIFLIKKYANSTYKEVA